MPHSELSQQQEQQPTNNSEEQLLGDSEARLRGPPGGLFASVLTIKVSRSPFLAGRVASALARPPSSRQSTHSFQCFYNITRSLTQGFHCHVTTAPAHSAWQILIIPQRRCELRLAGVPCSPMSSYPRLIPSRVSPSCGSTMISFLPSSLGHTSESR